MTAKKENKNFKLSPPDGGWGYIIVISTTVMLISTFVPLGIFGIIFGDFLAERGDATSSITLINSTFNTISFFMGIVANVLLNRISFRKVGLLGCAIHFTGTVATIFVSSLPALIFSFGIVQGVGYGLLVPAMFSAFNAYFDEKMAFMMSVCQTVVVLGYMVAPYVGTWCLAQYGFRGSLIMFAGLSAFLLPAAIALQPVKWHLKKEIVDKDAKGLSIEDVVASPLLTNEKPSSGHTNIIHRRRESSVLMVERFASALSITHLKDEDKNSSFWQSISRSMDFSLLKDPKYISITVGLALSFTADVAFFPILPSIMSNIGFNQSQVALMLSVFFGADLTARITLSIASALCKVNSRMLVFAASALTAVFRIVLLLNDTLNYKLAVLAALGFIRCFIQTPQSLVIASNYPDNFESAYSVYMVVNGVVSLIVGPLISYVKSATNSDVMVCYLLTAVFTITVLTWSAELLVCRRKGKLNPTTDS